MPVRARCPILASVGGCAFTGASGHRHSAPPSVLVGRALGRAGAHIVIVVLGRSTSASRRPAGGVSSARLGGHRMAARRLPGFPLFPRRCGLRIAATAALKEGVHNPKPLRPASTSQTRRSHACVGNYCTLHCAAGAVAPVSMV